MESHSICSNLVGDLVTEVASGVEFNKRAFALQECGKFVDEKTAQSFSVIAADMKPSLLLETRERDGVSMYQVRVHQQQKGNPSCGQFAVHNSLSILRALTEPCESAASELLSNSLQSGACVWEQYHTIEKFLLETAVLKNKNVTAYPWNEKSIKTGILERAHSSLVIQEYPRIMALRRAGVQFSAVPDINRRILPHLQEIFSQKQYCHAFLMGAVDHWNVIVINKHPSLPQVEMIVADSRNEPLLNIDLEKRRDELTLEAEQKEAIALACGKRIDALAYERQFKLKIHLEYLGLAQRNVEAFALCGSEKLDIRQFFVDVSIQWILNNFRKNAMENGATSKELVIRWLKYFCPPRMLISDHVWNVKVVGPDYLGKECNRHLREWIHEMREYENECEFKLVLDELQSFVA